MTKLNNVTVIFKRNLVLKQLKKLLNNEGFNVTIKKDVNKIGIINLKKAILIIEIMSEKELQDICMFFEKKTRNSFILFILQKKLELPVNFRNSKILIQPLSFDELLRNLIMLQKSFEENRANVKFNNLNYYPIDSKLIDNRNGNIIKLTDLENKLISFMLNNSQGCSKSEILKNVWQHSAELNTHTMESLIYRLRRKIENNPNKPKIFVQIENKYFLKST